MKKQEFTQFKKEITKELKLRGFTFSMNSRQEALHTATISGIYAESYEETIKYFERAKANSNNETYIKHCEESIEHLKNRIVCIKRPYNYAVKLLEDIRNSQAFKKLNNVEIKIELVNNYYIFRLNY